MTEIIIALTCLVSIVGIFGVVWSLYSTRQKYYNEYIQRKNND
ncbi:hypothetical protein SAMN05216326_15215 [Nitrosomonas marina]|uniref:Uncharacterized protein n=1 Tax=Nitrosomonas marina TaxID=917 RepID=A0A1I0G3P7_9PROT|nr:hypothetical protein SAMN05216326_15215 [Nitrosomonas marina]